MAANSCVPAGPDQFTDILLEPVLVVWHRYISIDVVLVPEPLPVLDTFDQTLQPPPETPAPLTEFAFSKLTKSTIKSPMFAGDTARVAGFEPVEVFQLFTYEIATLVTWLAQEENTSWLASVALAARHCPTAAWAEGSVSE
jgi:hypothetical protein